MIDGYIITHYSSTIRSDRHARQETQGSSALRGVGVAGRADWQHGGPRRYCAVSASSSSSSSCLHHHIIITMIIVNITIIIIIVIIISIIMFAVSLSSC